MNCVRIPLLEVSKALKLMPVMLSVWSDTLAWQNFDRGDPSLQLLYPTQLAFCEVYATTLDWRIAFVMLQSGGSLLLRCYQTLQSHLTPLHTPAPSLPFKPPQKI